MFPKSPCSQRSHTLSHAAAAVWNLGPRGGCGFPHHEGRVQGGDRHRTSALQNTHQPAKPREEPVKKAAVLLTPKQEPMETPVPKISDESSSSTEEDDPPSSPELRKAKRSRFQRKATSKSKGSGWTCGVCHSWFPERDEYVSHMKKDHGKVRGRGATGGEGSAVQYPHLCVSRSR